MATYKQPCIHCSEMIERDSRVCAKCGSRSPFRFQCPNCLKEVVRGNMACSSCGKPLLTKCPYCEAQTFIGCDRCDVCKRSLMVKCGNKLCGELQYFSVDKCKICGKPIKDGKKQLAKVAKLAKGVM